MRNYFYDMYGSVLLLMGESGLAHVFAHSYFNQVFNKGLHGRSLFEYTEEPGKKRFPAIALHTLSSPHYVLAGDHIGYAGDAGFSSGPHIHYEIHRGREWIPWASRPRPEELFPDIWKEWKNKI